MRNKNNPMRRDAAWGCGSKKEHAPERHNFPCGDGAPRDVGWSGRLRLSGACDVPDFPQARASRRAWGYVCSAPVGRSRDESAIPKKKPFFHFAVFFVFFALKKKALSLSAGIREIFGRFFPCPRVPAIAHLQRALFFFGVHRAALASLASPEKTFLSLPLTLRFSSRSSR